MTDFSDPITLIAQVGFPIAMCLLLWWQMNNTIKANTDAITSNKEATLSLISTTSSLKDAIEKFKQ